MKIWEVEGGEKYLSLISILIAEWKTLDCDHPESEIQVQGALP